MVESHSNIQEGKAMNKNYKKIQTSSFILIYHNIAGYNEMLGWRFSYRCLCQKMIKAHRRDTQEDKTLEGNIETELEDSSAVKDAC